MTVGHGRSSSHEERPNPIGSPRTTTVTFGMPG